MVLKDDMKGLGFNKAREDEVTGLDVFSDLLSRLNGKSEEAVESDRQARAAIKTNIWVERKYGPMRFVRGGLLVGDKLEEEENSSSSSEEEAEVVKVEVVKKDKKRKAEEMESEPVKKEKKSKKQKSSSDEDEELTKKEKKKEKKSKKEKKDKKSKKSKAADSENESSADAADKKKTNKSKSKSKESSADISEDEAKRLKKEKKKLKKAAAAAAAAAGSEETPADSGSSTPATGTSTPRNRNFVRSKFIAQKKQAFLDTKALHQVCCSSSKHYSFRQWTNSVTRSLWSRLDWVYFEKEFGVYLTKYCIHGVCFMARHIYLTGNLMSHHCMVIYVGIRFPFIVVLSLKSFLVVYIN